MASSPVQGYVYHSVDENDIHNGNICKILRRATISDNELREMGPAFRVEFGDGSTKNAYSEELSPWFPV